MATTLTQYIERTVRPPARERVERRTRVLGMDAEQLAYGLGWFSIGLGLTEVIAPQAIARLTGTRIPRSLIRGYGLRKIGSGIGILTWRRSAAPVWSRVAGDALELGTLGAALAAPRNERGRTIGAIAAVSGVTVLDVLCARELSNGRGAGRAEASLIVNRPVDEVYRYWRQIENLPRFMSYLESVRITGDRRSHWVARTPGNARVEWDAEIQQDVPNERLMWRSLPGSDIYNSGSVEFESAPGGRGTIVRVQMDYSQPGRAAAAFAKLLGKDPEQTMYKDLRRFKQVIETGEVITTEGQPAGRNSGATWLDSIAR